MVVIVTLSAFFGSYTTVFIAVFSLFLWIFLSTPLKTCPFGYKRKISHDESKRQLGISLPNNKTDVPMAESPKKKVRKIKKCSGKGCSKKKGHTIVHVFFSSAFENVSNFAQKLQEKTLEINMKCSLFPLEASHDAINSLSTDIEATNVFILNDRINKNEQFEKWLFDLELKKLSTCFKFVVLAINDQTQQVALNWDSRLWQIGGQRLKKAATVMTDESLDAWLADFISLLTGKPKKKCCGSGDDEKSCSSDSSCGGSDSEGSAAGVVDMEDLVLLKRK